MSRWRNGATWRSRGRALTDHASKLPPCPRGLWQMVSASRAGDRLELLDYDRARHTFEILARMWTPRGGVEVVSLKRVNEPRERHLLLTEKGWQLPESAK